jgi:ABC-type methionine transport system ATPase subunit
MATKSKTIPPARRAPKTARRLWLSYPPKQITQPIIWQMSQKFPVIFDIRQASVTDEIGILCLELEGAESDVEAAIGWLRKMGVRVEPVELSAMES